MKRVSLALLALVIGATACQEIATAPNGSDPQVRYRLSNPPPPPIDTGATGSFFPDALQNIQAATPGTSITGMKTFTGPKAADVAPFEFTVPVRYLENKQLNSAYVHFRNDTTNSSTGGSVTQHNGTLNGNGILTIRNNEGVLTINLSSIQQPPSFLGCFVEIGDASSSAPPTSSGGVCFNLTFQDATFTPFDTNEPPVHGSVDMIPSFISECTTFC